MLAKCFIEHKILVATQGSRGYTIEKIDKYTYIQNKIKQI